MKKNSLHFPLLFLILLFSCSQEQMGDSLSNEVSPEVNYLLTIKNNFTKDNGDIVSRKVGYTASAWEDNGPGKLCTNYPCDCLFIFANETMKKEDSELSDRFEEAIISNNLTHITQPSRAAVDK